MHDLMNGVTRAPPPRPRLLRIAPNGNCEGGMMLGLTHQRLNLECALQLATLVGRKLQVAPLQEHRRHTRCAQSHSTAWADASPSSSATAPSHP